jgi:hypothetical protein
MEKVLKGKKVAVLVETEYIPEEIDLYQKVFFRGRCTGGFSDTVMGCI